MALASGPKRPEVDAANYRCPPQELRRKSEGYENFQSARLDDRSAIPKQRLRPLINQHVPNPAARQFDG
jgi:hypothetical protein